MNIPESKSTKMPWEFPRHWTAALVGAAAGPRRDVMGASLRLNL